MPLIELRSVTKCYSAGVVDTFALRDVTMTIDRGEFVCIEGPSGCGKSTLLAILGMLDVPDSGDYFLDGKAVSEFQSQDRSRTRNREIGFIFQNFNLIGDLNVEDNVALPLTYRGMSPRERKRRVAESLERVGMAARMRHFPAQLSGGQQQRAAVARALAGEPSILLADEPTGNLDTENGAAVMKLLSELHESGSTIVMVTHDARFVHYAERRIALLDGRLQQPAANLVRTSCAVGGRYDVALPLWPESHGPQ